LLPGHWIRSKPHPDLKSQSAKHHPDNRMSDRYPIEELVKLESRLAQCKIERGDKVGLDFSKPECSLWLNKALLQLHYGINNWQIPQGYLVPPVPGRLDYILYTKDVITESGKFKLPGNTKLFGLDIGTGASLIFPILAVGEMKAYMTATDVDENALDSCRRIIDNNPGLSGHIKPVLQKNPSSFFAGVIGKRDHFDFCITNPPFFKSLNEAEKAGQRRENALARKKGKTADRLPAGKVHELVYPGGEKRFIASMIRQSKAFGSSVLWFSSLVSSRDHLHFIGNALKNAGVSSSKLIENKHGNKSVHYLYWTFLNEAKRADWVAKYWNV